MDHLSTHNIFFGLRSKKNNFQLQPFIWRHVTFYVTLFYDSLHQYFFRHVQTFPVLDLVADVFVCLDSLCYSQQFFSHVGTGLHGLNQF